MKRKRAEKNRAEIFASLKKTADYQKLVDPTTLGTDAPGIYLANRIDHAINLGIEIGRRLNG